MPLLRGTELLGIFELLSSEAYAFGDRDEGTLEVLAARVLSNLERAAQVLAPQRQSLPVAEPIQEAVPEASHGFWGGFGVVTWAMAVAVLVCAVLLGVQVGRHMGGQRARVRRQRAATPAHAFAGQAPSVEDHASGKTVTTSAPPPAAVKPSFGRAVPPGGLRIYENGKEVFRLPTAENQTGDAAEAGMQPASSLEPEKVMELSPATAEGSLLRRVEPEYPEQARQQRVQGPVVLEVHIGADGTVQDVQVVSGPAQLAAASADAVKQWQFKPRSKDGRRVEMQTTVTLNFRLPE
jgi:TonB family protein